MISLDSTSTLVLVIRDLDPTPHPPQLDWRHFKDLPSLATVAFLSSRSYLDSGLKVGSRGLDIVQLLPLVHECSGVFAISGRVWFGVVRRVPIDAEFSL